MRIAIVSPYDLAVPGGVQQHVEYLANALAERGDDLLVLGPGPDPLPAGNTIEQVQRASVGSSTKLRFNASVAPLALAPNSARRTLATLRRFAPDVVHIHEPSVPWVSMTAAARGPRPIVATFHAWSDTDRAYRSARPALSRLFSRLDGFVAVSPVAAKYHAGALGLSEGRFKVIPNGVDVARFRDASPMDGEVDASRPLVLFAGRLEER
ncbi:MAG: phosphatidylinositol alpha-mannosyltransferase, partial [Glaciecola sp.]